MNDSSSNKHSTNMPYESFDLIKSTYIESINLTLHEYKHKVTDASHFHLETDNDENVFMVAFRTIPTDSTGVAHILEHTVLCGSEKFPVRDPFFMMIRRSLNTFMNAMTSSDWTAYPFASKNKKDFDNLLQIYLDAVFFSRLDEMDFLQEGFRVDFENEGDKNSDLVYKGVVYNEMKGAMSSPMSVAWQAINKYLFPTVTYHYNSGGDPENIPDLSYEELLAFYRKHYHPSNAIFFTYGDIPAIEHQKRIEELALSRFEKGDTNISVGKEKRFDKPIREVEAIAVADTNENKSQMIMAWLLGDNTDLSLLFKAEFLSGVLLDNSASPLRYYLENSGIASAPSPLCGLESSHKEITFMCGIDGVTTSDIEEFEKGVIAVLEKVAEEGIPYERMESYLHQLELSQREVGGDGDPYGLQLIFGAVSAAVHRGDVVSLLNIDPVLAKLREDIKAPEFIKDAVKELLLNNSHRVSLFVKQDEELEDKKNKAEKERLSKIKNSLSEDEINEVIKTSKLLEDRQNQIDDDSILPKVGIEDIPSEINFKNWNKLKIDPDKSIDCFQFNETTNGLVYHQIVSPVSDFVEEDLGLLALFSSIVSELGFGDKSYLETQNIQSAICGGISSFFSYRGDVDDPNQIKAYFTYSGKSLISKFDQFALFLKEHYETARFDEHDRIKDLISQISLRRQNGIVNNGHLLAINAAASGFSSIARISNRMSGVLGIKSLMALEKAIKDGQYLERISQEFNNIQEKLLLSPKTLLLINDKDKSDSVVNTATSIWNNNLSGCEKFDEISKTNQSFASEKINQIWTCNTQVNFCAYVYPTVSIGNRDAAPLSVLGPFLKNGYLHKAIREQGGAYGSGASQDSAMGVFKFFSYRDPRDEETFEDFRQSIEWLLANDHGYEKLEEAILGVIGGMDKPGSPAGESKKEFYNVLFERTQEQRKQFRENILKVTVDDLKRVASKYLKDVDPNKVIVTNPALVERKGDMGMEVNSLL